MHTRPAGKRVCPSVCRVWAFGGILASPSALLGREGAQIVAWQVAFGRSSASWLESTAQLIRRLGRRVSPEFSRRVPLFLLTSPSFTSFGRRQTIPISIMAADAGRGSLILEWGTLRWRAAIVVK